MAGLDVGLGWVGLDRTRLGCTWRVAASREG